MCFCSKIIMWRNLSTTSQILFHGICIQFLFVADGLSDIRSKYPGYRFAHATFSAIARKRYEFHPSLIESCSRRFVFNRIQSMEHFFLCVVSRRSDCRAASTVYPPLTSNRCTGVKRSSVHWRKKTGNVYDFQNTSGFEQMKIDLHVDIQLDDGKLFECPGKPPVQVSTFFCHIFSEVKHKYIFYNMHIQKDCITNSI